MGVLKAGGVATGAAIGLTGDETGVGLIGDSPRPAIAADCPATAADRPAMAADCPATAADRPAIAADDCGAFMGDGFVSTL
ncbi:MAG: hypothetical protein KME14_10230 [Tildeniella torsiva UHER 1998/13D]|nr:hypothetical protein [Tildeniella torsiva UHER 1998/13D]